MHSLEVDACLTTSKCCIVHNNTDTRTHTRPLVYIPSRMYAKDHLFSHKIPYLQDQVGTMVRLTPFFPEPPLSLFLSLSLPSCVTDWFMRSSLLRPFLVDPIGDDGNLSCDDTIKICGSSPTMDGSRAPQGNCVEPRAPNQVLRQSVGLYVATLLLLLFWCSPVVVFAGSPG